VLGVRKEHWRMHRFRRRDGTGDGDDVIVELKRAEQFGKATVNNEARVYSIHSSSSLCWSSWPV
jgi:hypothetical protein